MKKIRVAVVQAALVEAEPADNWKKIRGFLEQAGAGGADLVVLPEMWLTGYAYRRFEELARLTPESLRRVGAVAKRHGCHVVGSWPERGHDGRLYNTAWVIGRDGRPAGSYRKVHLFGPMKETRYFAPGGAFVPVELDFGKIGLGLCYDLRFPEQSRKLALAGARLLVFPSQWPEARIHHFQTLLAARAIENQVFAIGANRAGRNAAIVFGGGSTIVDPRGEIVAQLGPEEGFIEAEVDLDAVAQARTDAGCYLEDRVRELDEFLCR